jgi:hypothetical protein
VARGPIIKYNIDELKSNIEISDKNDWIKFSK